MIKLGLDTWLWASTFQDKHLFCIKTAKELGAEAIDFSINDPFQFPVKRAAELVKEYGLIPVTSTAMSLEYNPISDDKVVRKNAMEFMKRLITITVELGGTITGGVNYTASGYLTGKPRTRDELERSMEYMHKMAEYAKQYNITIAIEAIKRFESHIINTAEQALEYVNELNEPNVKVHLDTFHMNIEERNILEAIEKCGDKLAYLHFVDSNRGAPGMGHIPWIDIYKTLYKIHYNGIASIETFNPQTLDETCCMTFLNRKFADTPEELARKGLEYLRAVQIIVDHSIY
ncbi:MAG: sugar phosphate isomerase/epimerase [Lachnospiraceae bacterium]|nr:sugar phosphate isomerase/epimerase [Lachnospiraceae bacterium]